MRWQVVNEKINEYFELVVETLYDYEGDIITFAVSIPPPPPPPPPPPLLPHTLCRRDCSPSPAPGPSGGTAAHLHLATVWTAHTFTWPQCDPQWVHLVAATLTRLLLT